MLEIYSWILKLWISTKEWLTKSTKQDYPNGCTIVQMKVSKCLQLFKHCTLWKPLKILLSRWKPCGVQRTRFKWLQWTLKSKKLPTFKKVSCTKRLKNFQQLSRVEARKHATPVVNHKKHSEKRQSSRESLITWPGRNKSRKTTTNDNKNEAKKS